MTHNQRGHVFPRRAQVIDTAALRTLLQET